VQPGHVGPRPRTRLTVEFDPAIEVSVMYDPVVELTLDEVA
jgi:hypothetical protein